MRKEYHIPTIEVISVNTRLMQDFGDWSNHGSPKTAPARIAPVPQGAVKSF